MKRPTVLWLVLASFLIFAKPQVPWAQSVGPVESDRHGCTVPVTPEAAKQSILYVATDGDDFWSGKMAKPNASHWMARFVRCRGLRRPSAT